MKKESELTITDRARIDPIRPIYRMVKDRDPDSFDFGKALERRELYTIIFETACKLIIGRANLSWALGKPGLRNWIYPDPKSDILSDALADEIDYWIGQLKSANDICSIIARFHG